MAQAHSSHSTFTFDEGSLMVSSIASAARLAAPGTARYVGASHGLAIALVTAMAASLWWSAPAAAQDTQSLINRIDRLERDIQSMSRQVYSGGAPKGGAAPSSSGGGSVPSGDYATRLEDRISTLEGQITQMTGTVETLLHSNSELTARIERMSKDNEMRFKEMEGGGAAPRAAAQSNEAPQTASRDGNLGTLNPRDLAAPPSGSKGGGAPEPQQRASLPAGSPQQQYDYAYGLLGKARSDADYANAAQAFKDFLEKNPNGPLASAARYWMGQSYFIAKDYQTAASIFLDGYQKDQKGQKAPDTLLKLGMSLTYLDKKREACATFDKLTKDFPGPAKEFKTLPNERKRAGCA
jgi:tol-pal system protein YbgF